MDGVGDMLCKQELRRIISALFWYYYEGMARMVMGDQKNLEKSIVAPEQGRLSNHIINDKV
jgi:hypothetical protein